jgi:GNAT superfamily N-acetyltransferase
MFYIRSFKIGDEEEIYRLFYETVHTINAKDYTQAQINVMAPLNPNIEEWRKSLVENHSFVAVKKDDNKVVGFADLTNEGNLNRGYVHKDYQGLGIGQALLEAREDKARELGIKELFSDVSVTAKSFFERHGYAVQEKKIRMHAGMEFEVYLMRKVLK